MTQNIPCYEHWQKEDGNVKGRCCCNCKYQVEITPHPWNEMTGGRMKGPIRNTAGWGCSVTNPQRIIFLEWQHDICEEHTWRYNPE